MLITARQKMQNIRRNTRFVHELDREITCDGRLTSRLCQNRISSGQSRRDLADEYRKRKMGYHKWWRK